MAVPRRPTTGARERILDAAGSLFYARGVRAVGMNEVVEAAGCGKNLLYAQFPSKVDLVAAYLERFRARRVATADAVLRGHDGDPAAQLVALTAEVARRADAPGFRGCAMRNYLVEFPDADDAASRVARSYLRDSRAAVAALVDHLGVERRRRGGGADLAGRRGPVRQRDPARRGVGRADGGDTRRGDHRGCPSYGSGIDT